MKTNTLKAAAAVGLSALLLGTAAAQESVSKPVGYETLNYTSGFNYLGLRLVEAPASNGSAAMVDGTTITVADGVADALVADTTYIFEVISGDALGAVTTVASFDADADTLTLTDDISGDFVGDPDPDMADKFIVRPASTLESVFGPLNDVANSGVGLTSTGSFGTSDQIWIPDGAGSFSKYAYVQGNPFAGIPTGWKNAAGDEIVPADISLIYTDGIILNGAAAGDVVVSGSVKLEPVSIALTTTFNYVSSVFPAGLTLAESELENTVTSTGSFGTSDQLWLSDGAGGFDKYAYVQGNPFANIPTGWKNEAGDEIVPEDVSFDDNSGVIVFRGGGADKMIVVDSPDFYDTL